MIDHRISVLALTGLLALTTLFTACDDGGVPR